MQWAAIASIILQLTYVGISTYAANNPKASWAGPVATALATVTKTPQTAAKDIKLANKTLFIACLCITAWQVVSVFI